MSNYSQKIPCIYADVQISGCEGKTRREKNSKSYTRIRWGKNWKTAVKTVLAFRIALLSLATELLVVQCHKPVTIHICEQSAVLHTLAINIYIN